MMIVMMDGVHECVDATIYYRFRLGPGCGCTLALPSMVQQGSSRSRPAVMSIAIAILLSMVHGYVGPWPRATVMVRYVVEYVDEDTFTFI